METVAPGTLESLLSVTTPRSEPLTACPKAGAPAIRTQQAMHRTWINMDLSPSISLDSMKRYHRLPASAILADGAFILSAINIFQDHRDRGQAGGDSAFI